MAKRLNLFIDWGSQPSRAVAWFMHVNSIPFDVQQVRVMKGEMRKPEFRKVNPLGKIPAITDVNGRNVFESHSIYRYLAHTYGDLVRPQWYATASADLDRHLALEQYLDFHHIGVRVPNANLYLHSFILPTLGLRSSPEVEAHMKKAYATGLRELAASPWFCGLATDDEQPATTGKRRFLLGNEPSVADIACFTELEQVELLGLFPWIDPALPADAVERFLTTLAPMRAWYSRMKTVEGYAESHETFLKLCSRASAQPKL